MTPEDLAYAAGSIDSDGYISIHKTSKKARKLYHSAIIGFTNTFPQVPSFFLSRFGGRINEYQPSNPRHKKWYMWTADGNVAYRAIKLIRPYLKMKKKQATIVLRFVDHCQRQIPRIRKARNLSPSMIRVREKYWKAIRKLNQPRNCRVHFD